MLHFESFPKKGPKRDQKSAKKGPKRDRKGTKEETKRNQEGTKEKTKRKQRGTKEGLLVDIEVKMKEFNESKN